MEKTQLKTHGIHTYQAHQKHVSKALEIEKIIIYRLLVTTVVFMINTGKPKNIKQPMTFSFPLAQREYKSNELLV